MEDEYGIVVMELRKGIDIKSGPRYFTRYAEVCGQRKLNTQDTTRVKVRYTIKLECENRRYKLVQNIARRIIVDRDKPIKTSMDNYWEELGWDTYIPANEVGQIIGDNYWMMIDDGYIRLNLKTGKGYVYKELNPIMYVIL